MDNHRVESEKAAESHVGAGGYVPGLDGVRALAVAAVMAYHLQVPLADGGLLGVSVFFTLSGYLITSLLIHEFERNGRIGLRAFWMRRARRLLPALFLLLAVVLAATAIARPDKLSKTAWRTLSALFYIANWTTIAEGDDYFRRFAGHEPLDHLWSLSIEEQFYIMWPLLVFALLAVGRRIFRRRRLSLLAMATVLLATASTWAISHLFDPHMMNNTRAYEGTDARAAALLVGAMTSLLLPLERVRRIAPAGRAWLDLIGIVGLGGVLGCIVTTDEYSLFLYRGGEIVLSLATAALTVAAAHPETAIGRAFAIVPLRWVGARSYGIYLWHLPVVFFVPTSLTIKPTLLLNLLRVALVLGLSAISYRWIEDPIRRRRPVFRPAAVRWRFVLRGLAIVVTSVLVLTIWAWGFSPPGEPVALDTDPTFSAPWYPTSCKQVIHVGDSTSEGLVSIRKLSNLDHQIGARYRAVGVEHLVAEIEISRGMLEALKGSQSATEVARQRRLSGYDGCWIVAMGTNDPAAVGGDLANLTARIEGMMKEIGSAPVLWTTTKTLLDKGPYQNANMQNWNAALLMVCARHPNMRVYDWAVEVQKQWFDADGIHFNRAGYRHRAARLARALAHAFPKDGPAAPGCVVYGDAD